MGCICLLYTSTGGSAANVILDNLDVNQVYTLVETKAPEGYTLNSEPLYFQVGADGRLLDADGKALLVPVSYTHLFMLPRLQTYLVPGDR